MLQVELAPPQVRTNELTTPRRGALSSTAKLLRIAINELATIDRADGRAMAAASTPLPATVYYSARDGNERMVLEYLDGGGHVDAREEQRRYTLLFGACLGGHAQLLPMLLEQGCAIDAVDCDSCTR